jgi:hypothetical protein
MRQIFSVRFFAAVGGVVGLFFLLTTIFATREVIEGGDGGPAPVELHRIDFIEEIQGVTDPRFALSVEGMAANDTDLVIDPSRTLRIVEDTPGVDHCPRFPAAGACAVVADLLGEAVVWFALVPNGTNRTVDLPAIDTLDDGLATLVNGWQLPFAPVLDRRCAEEFTSYREFRDTLGDDFTSVYDIDERRLTAVECNLRVDYAPVVTVADDDLSDDVVPAAPTGTSGDVGIDDALGDDELNEALIDSVVGARLPDAIDRLEAAGWTVRTDDIDDPDQTFTADLRLDRVTVGHRDGVVVSVRRG